VRTGQSQYVMTFFYQLSYLLAPYLCSTGHRPISHRCDRTARLDIRIRSDGESSVQKDLFASGQPFFFFFFLMYDACDEICQNSHALSTHFIDPDAFLEGHDGQHPIAVPQFARQTQAVLQRLQETFCAGPNLAASLWPHIYKPQSQRIQPSS
jgi:hypothetical protein